MEPGDDTTLSLDVLHSKLDAERTEPFLEAISFARGNATERPFISCGFDVSNPANWVVSEVRERPSDQTNEFDTARIDTAFELNDTFTLKGGVSWKEYGFDVVAGQRDTTLPINNSSCLMGRPSVPAARGYQQGYGDNDLPAGMAIEGQRQADLYDKRLYCGLGFDTRGLIMPRYGLERRNNSVPPGFGRRFHLQIENDRHIVTIRHSLDGKQWKKCDVQMEVSGYHHNVAYDFLSLRPAIYVAGNGAAVFRLHAL